MSRSSGTYTLPAGNPVVTGTTVSSTWANNTLNDIAAALTASIANDGQTPILANIPMNSKKITGLAAGTTSGDALSYGQTGMGALNGSTGTFSGALTAVGYTFTGTTSGTFTMSATGVPYGSALHNNAGAVTGTANQYICSGTYTPTLTATSNFAGTPTVNGTFKWIRVGNVVHVSGQIGTGVLTSGADTTTDLKITLPIASSFTTASDLTGSAGTTVADKWSLILADAAGDRANLLFAASTTSGHTYYLTFLYEVL